MTEFKATEDLVRRSLVKHRRWLLTVILYWFSGTSSVGELLEGS